MQQTSGISAPVPAVHPGTALLSVEKQGICLEASLYRAAFKLSTPPFVRFRSSATLPPGSEQNAFPLLLPSPLAREQVNDLRKAEYDLDL